MITKIQQAASAAMQSAFGAAVEPEKIQVTHTRKGQKGDFTVLVFPLVKLAKKSPVETATTLGELILKDVAEVARFEVVQGFLNLTLAPSHWLGVLNNVLANPRYGYKEAAADAPLVMIEYSSPNTNKPLHLGHIRNILLGYSLSRLVAACGNRVVKTNIVNDRGIHICKSMLAWKLFGNGCTPESLGQKGDHLVGDYYVKFDKEFKAELKQILESDPEIQAINYEPKEGDSPETIAEKTSELRKAAAEQKSPLMQQAREMLRLWEAGDPEVRKLWETMNGWVYAGFDETYKALGVDFDKIYYESQTYQLGKEKVLEGLDKGVFYRRPDGSVWADLTKDGLDEKLLLRRDGTSVYMTQDIGTAKLRFDDYPIDKMVYVVGNEQNYHFQVLSIVLDRLGFKWGKSLVHFSYGMVELPEGKMKSREGTVVDADDLVQQMVDTAREMGREQGRLDGLTPEQCEQTFRVLALGALKYFILKVDPKKNMTFNPRESIDFNGNTGPFIQYAYARIQSVLRKAADGVAGGAGANASSDGAVSFGSVTPVDKEIQILRIMEQFPVVLQEAGNAYSPALIANYAYDLAKEFNQYYHDFQILREPDEAMRSMRLALCRAVAQTLKNAMWILGVEMPERM